MPTEMSRRKRQRKSAKILIALLARAPEVTLAEAGNLVSDDGAQCCVVGGEFLSLNCLFGLSAALLVDYICVLLIFVF